MNKRIAKRFARENRKNKGAGSAAKLQARNAAARAARDRFGLPLESRLSGDELALISIAAMLGRRK